jgi:hypothetical protein
MRDLVVDGSSTRDKEVRRAIVRNVFAPRSTPFYGIFMSASAAT